VPTASSRPSAGAFRAANRCEIPGGANLGDFRRLVAARTPKRVLCGNDAIVNVLEDRSRALHGFTHYLTHTEKWNPVIALDLDDRDPLDLIMSGAQIPFPTWVVYNSLNGHAHAVYALADPVTLGPNGRPKPLRTLHLVHKALRMVLSGDTSHKNGITRTPWHSQHVFYPVLFKRWELKELAALMPSEIAEVKRREAVMRPVPEERLDQAEGRNDELYMRTVYWAMNQARAGHFGTLNFDTISAAAHSMNTYNPPLPAGEVRTISRSVDKFMQKKWVGNRSDQPTSSSQGSARSRQRSWQRTKLTPEEAQQRRQAGAAQAAASKTATTRAAIALAAERIRQTGQIPTSRAIAAITELSVRTVKTHADLYR
jgi:hypothetical protein